jgi:hypothetical protein
MCLFPERPDSDSDWEHPEDGHHAVYFVKRPACAFISARGGQLPRKPQ